jgi:VIT1/CCC1 family predicted Fe2+/Mn2+ transporter
MTLSQSTTPQAPIDDELDRQRQQMERERAAAMRELAAIRNHHQVAPGAKGGLLRASVFGINDGLVSNLSLVAGVSAAAPDPRFVLVAGMAGLVAGAFSMGAGEYASVRAQREVFEGQIERERWALEHEGAQERDEIVVIFRAKGVPRDKAEQLADLIVKDPAIALDLMAREELGLDPDELGSPWGAAIGSFISFAIGATLPIVPLLVFDPATALVVALAVCGLVLFGVGALTAYFSQRPLVRVGVRMLFIGALATAVTYSVGLLVGNGVPLG